jgi:hypothetical protein
MREFQIGDKVRWYEVDGRPMWNFDEVEAHVGGSGCWVEGIVRRVYVRDNEFSIGLYMWPQPGHYQARYGEPGYLELVEEAREPKYRVEEAGCGDNPVTYFYIADDHGAEIRCFHESCRAELEALCAKMNEEGK